MVSGPLLLLKELPLLCKTHRKQLHRRKIVLMKVYAKQAGMGQGRSKKVQVAEEVAAMDCKARAEVGSSSTLQLSGIPVSPRGLKDHSGFCSMALGEGEPTSAASFQPSRMMQCAAGLPG